MSDHLKYELALYHAQGFGNRSYHQLLTLLDFVQLTLADIFHDPSLLNELLSKLKASPEEYPLSGKRQLNKKQLNLLIEYLRQPAWKLVEEDLKWNEQEHNHLLSSTNLDYPQLLKQQTNYPMLMYVMGNPLLLKDIQIAIVGSRNPSPSAIDNAKQFAYYLAQEGMVITSGLALGIDTAAHQGALNAKGKTIAIAGTGIDRVYPAKNKDLAHKIVETGAIISEFPLQTGPLRQNFPKRNQVISGLSVGTLVIEAAIKSGSLITARLAMEQGREVFAIPGSIHNPLAKGCHHLIKQGAKLVECADDILEEISPLSFASSSLQQGQALEHDKLQQQQLALKKQPFKHQIKATLPKDQQKILSYLDDSPISIDQLQQRSQLSIDDVNSLLIILEIEGYVQSVAGGKVVRLYPS
jgi:DNA processing protein